MTSVHIADINEIFRHINICGITVNIYDQIVNDEHETYQLCGFADKNNLHVHCPFPLSGFSNISTATNCT